MRSPARNAPVAEPSSSLDPRSDDGAREPQWVVDVASPDAIDDDDATVALLWRHNPKSRVGAFARRAGPPRAQGPARRVPESVEVMETEDTAAPVLSDFARRVPAELSVADPGMVDAPRRVLRPSAFEDALTFAEAEKKPKPEPSMAAGAALFVLGAVSALALVAIILF